VVLSHAHCDHRGAANELNVPVLCHRDELADAQADGDPAYFDLSALSPLARAMTRFLHARWDGGAVRISDTVAGGDEIAGFEVIDLPGHAPGHVGLWRPVDRLALVADAFYRVDPTTGRPRPPLIPPSAFNVSGEALARLLLRIAELDPRSAWPSHGPPLSGVESQISRLARSTP
jgi:glyoxylase-like metal-dependent hydrolase (beta-lactamase superfamily II)